MATNVSLKGSAFYRVAFVVFIAGCLYNAFSAYITNTVDSFYYDQASDAATRTWEAWAYLGLSFILAIECVGLIMFKWMKSNLKGVI